MILDLRKKLDTNETTSEQLFKESVSKAKKYQDEYNSFVTILDTYNHTPSTSLLNGIPYALKDNISTKDILTTASSNILKDYVPVYSATVYKKLQDAGAVLVGKTVLDELAMGGTGTTGHTGIVKNPWNPTRQIGGSSAGSAACVALNIVPFAIGSDTGDSIRKPAAFGGVVGFKPTYGRISRYGLFAFASSLDHVGVLTRSVEDAAIVTDIIKGKDERDMTSLDDEEIKYLDVINNDIKGKKLFYIKELTDTNIYSNAGSETLEVLNKFKETIEKCKKLGFIVEEVSFDEKLLRAIYPSYMTISCAEATSNNSNLTGIIFGPRGEGDNINEIMFNARTNGFMEMAYKEYDAMILPASGGVAPLFDSEIDRMSPRYLLLENHLAIGNFGGFPSITIPSGFVNKMPIGINITGRAFEDGLVLNIANKIEEELGYKDLIKEEYDV